MGVLNYVLWKAGEEEGEGDLKAGRKIVRLCLLIGSTVADGKRVEWTRRGLEELVGSWRVGWLRVSGIVDVVVVVIVVVVVGCVGGLGWGRRM